MITYTIKNAYTGAVMTHFDVMETVPGAFVFATFGYGNGDWAATAGAVALVPALANTGAPFSGYLFIDAALTPVPVMPATLPSSSGIVTSGTQTSNFGGSISQVINAPILGPVLVPVAGGSTTGGSTTGGSAIGGPTIGGPVTGEPVTGGPINEGLVTGVPVTGGPAIEVGFTPASIPEPTTIALLGGALVMLGYKRSGRGR